MFPAVSFAQETKSNETRALQERVKGLEERLDKLDRVEAIKEVAEYVCPEGEISNALPPGGRCPDGSVPDERRTFRALSFSRRESLADKIEAAIAEAETKRVRVRELWLQLHLLKSRLNAVVGHIDLTSFFDRNAVANDETTKFLNTAMGRERRRRLLPPRVHGSAGALVRPAVAVLRDQCCDR